MPHKPVAVVVAMQTEVAPLVRGYPPSTVDGINLFEMESAIVAVGGIGRQAAHRAAGAVMDWFSPAVLVSAGIAGALTDSWHVGDVLFARDVVDADSGERFSAGGSAGTVVTASNVSGPAEKRNLAQRWTADVVDMEAAAVAKLAAANGIEFIAIKAVSDELDFVMPPVDRFVDATGKFETLRFAGFLALHPGWWQAVRQLSRNSSIATVNLSSALQHLIDQRSRIHSESKTVQA